ncbi:MAG: transposase [Deltaproteobacteria bacterium]|nr:transposase [Deltaproteobacteria bacterium]MBW2340823.1 transposase [Deltaproteobacteria bacterium]
MLGYPLQPSTHQQGCQDNKEASVEYLTYLKHRITNALSEALNAQVKKIKQMACAYRNREHHRTPIYFHCGGLDLYPRTKNYENGTTICWGHPQ